MARRGRGDAFLTFSADEAGLLRYVRNKLGQFQSGNQAMLAANRASIAHLKGEAVAVLNAKATRRYPDPRNDKRLVQIVGDDSAHEATQDRFSFWVLDKVEALDARARKFYRAIDEGSTYWNDGPGAGRYVALVFYPGFGQEGGGPSGPSPDVRYQAAYASPAGARVRITKPVPAYGFLTDPVQRFRAQGLYAQYVRDALRARGLRVRIKASP